jgi:hypothetical protein
MDKSILSEINCLREMTVGELRVEWQRLYGEPTRSRNKDFLWRRLAWRVQELAYGGLTDVAKARIAELGTDGFVRAQAPRAFAESLRAARKPRRDPRMPLPGSVIIREYRGQTLRLKVLDDGFELDGVHYGSLSEAARVVTGQRWNGPLFWGLRKRSR